MSNKIKRQIIRIDEDLCNGCGECVSACAENAIRLVNGKARLISERYCDGLGACIGECPTGALTIVEEKVEEFEGPAPAPACPSAQARTLARASAPDAGLAAPADSELGHWPVQVRLVSPSAPFLQGAHLLVAADCVPIAYASFHRDFLKGKVVLVGCPKFDDNELYLQRFTDILRSADIKSVTVVVMEVPCCQGLHWIVSKALAESGKNIPAEKVIIGVDGTIRQRSPLI